MKKEGTVTMSLEEYNDIYERLMRYKNAIKIKHYGDLDLEVHIDLEMLRPEILEKLKVADPNGEYIPCTDFYTRESTIARKKEEELEQ